MASKSLVHPLLRTLAIVGLIACSGEAEVTPEPAEDVPAKEAAPKPVKEAPAKEAPGKVVPLTLPEGHNPLLLAPAEANQTAPATYKVKVTTTKGPFVVEVHRDWAPLGADRFYNLVDIGFYDQARFFRAVDGFMVQWGISAYPQVSEIWKEATIKDDAVKQSNTRGRLTFATAGKDTRTTQLFINFKDNSNLDAMGFSPFGEVVEGMDVVDSLYKGYGEGQPRGRGPNQGKLQKLGNAYLDAEFEKLDGIEKMEIVN